MELIHKLYTSLDSPVCYAGAEKLYLEAQKHDPNIRKEQVNEYLQSNPTYTLHKPRRRRFRRLATVPSGYFTDFQVDLADFQRVAKYNMKQRYLLVGVEVLSRMAFAVPVKTKGTEDMKSAFRELFSQLPSIPWNIFSDRGVEFESKSMKAFFDEYGIVKQAAYNVEIKASMAERMIRTIKTRLYKYFTQHRTKRWIDAVPSIVAAINNSVNRSTGLRPIDFNFDNWEMLWKTYYEDAFRAGKNPKMIEGDRVRLASTHAVFDKGYLPNFSQKTYTVRRAKRTRPETYRLVGDKGHRLVGKYYKEQITRATHPPEKAVERVVATRPAGEKAGDREYRVTWAGEPESTASWIKPGDVEKPRRSARTKAHSEAQNAADESKMALVTRLQEAAMKSRKSLGISKNGSILLDDKRPIEGSNYKLIIERMLSDKGDLRAKIPPGYRFLRARIMRDPELKKLLDFKPSSWL